MTTVEHPPLGSHDEREASWDLPADPEFVAKSRRMVGEVLTCWGMSELAEDVSVIVSELYANSLIHGESPITFTLRVYGRILRGEVTDHGPLWPQPARAGADDEHGRGLAIVAILADRWGIDPLPGCQGKTIWFYRTPESVEEPCRQATAPTTPLPFPLTTSPSSTCRDA